VTPEITEETISDQEFRSVISGFISHVLTDLHDLRAELDRVAGMVEHLPAIGAVEQKISHMDSVLTEFEPLIRQLSGGGAVAAWGARRRASRFPGGGTHARSRGDDGG
jgi:hypothetical protein